MKIDIDKIKKLPPDVRKDFMKTFLQYQEKRKEGKIHSDFMAFVKHMWPEFIEGSHHKIVAEKFNQLAEGKLKRLIINMPPRHTKSEFASFLLPAWMVGRNPKLKIIQSTNTTELSVRFGRKAKALIDSEEYQNVFKTRLREDSQAAGKWETQGGGEYYAAGVGSAITGRGADLLIIDDPHSEQDAMNKEAMDRAYEWYTSGPRQRLQPGGAIILVMTRWNTKDLTGRLLGAQREPKADQWDVVEFPAILPSNKPLWPEYWKLEELEGVKASVSLQKWNAQYMQNPTSEEGAIIKREWWQVWDKDWIPALKHVIQSYDTAFSKKENADYSAITTWGVFYLNDDAPASLMLLDAKKGRYDFPELKQVAMEQYKYWDPDTVIVEAKASGQPLTDELRKMGIPVVNFTPSKGKDKHTRVNSVAPLFESGMIWAPEQEFAEEVIEECAAFPFGDHDDLVDSTTQAIMRFRQGGFVLHPDDEKDEAQPKEKELLLMGLLELLKALFGQKYLNKIIGTRTNVAKPIRMDKNSPFKRYANSAYDDPEIIALIEKKIDEYGPYALNNKNAQELANFEDNAKRLLAAKNKQTGTTEGMVIMSDLMKMTDGDLNALAKEGNDLKAKRILTGDDRERLSYIDNILEEAQKLPNTGKGLAEDIKAAGGKPEAEMFEFQTKQKLDDQGIMQLKEDMGLPPDVKPGSPMADLLNNRNKINQQFKEMGKAAQDVAAKSYSTAIEGKRRAAVRQMLLKDKRIKLTLAEEESLEDMLDLGKNADPTMDPLVLLNKYYKRDNKKLEMLDGIIDESLNPKDAADNFLAKDETLEVLDEDLGTRLENYDGDPDSLADGGRPGFKSGGLSLLNLFGKQGTNAAKQIKRSIDNIFTTDDAKYDADVVVDEIMEYLNIDRDAVNPNDISDLYGKAYSALTKQRFDAKKLMESVNQKGKGTVKTADNIPQPTKTLKSIEETGTIDISDDDIAGEFEAFMRRRDPEGMKTIDAALEKINSKTRTDNAEGGRIGFSSGTKKQIGMFGFQKLRDLIRNIAKERGVEGSDILKLMNYKNMQPDIKSRFSKKDFDKFKLEVQKSKMEQLENFRDMFQSRVTFTEAIEKGKAMDDGGTGMSDIFRYLDEDFSKTSPVPRDINEDDVLMMDQLIKNQTVKDDPRKLNAQGGLNYLMGL